MNTDIKHYLDSWAAYRIDCELRAKGRAKLTNDGWRKLRQYHLEQYLRKVESPFGFMFTIKYKHANIFKHISGGNQIYKWTLKQREEYFNDRARIKPANTPQTSQVRY